MSAPMGVWLAGVYVAAIGFSVYDLIHRIWIGALPLLMVVIVIVLACRTRAGEP